MATLRNFKGFVSAGYGWSELIINFLRLLVYSRICSAIQHRFHSRGKNVVIDFSVNIQGASFISIGPDSWVQRDARLSVPLIEMEVPPTQPVLRIGRSVQIGARCCLSAANDIEIEDDALFGPNVYLADHSHSYERTGLSIKNQGLTEYGRIKICKGAWIGINAVIIASNGKYISVGEGAIIGANSVVTRSVPARVMVGGVPAKIIKRLDAKLNCSSSE